MSLSNSVIAVLDGNADIVGTGFLVGEAVILTCAHVIEKAGGGKDQTVRIRFQFNGEVQNAQVSAECWREADCEDIAALHLLDHPPGGAVPLPLGDSTSSPGHPFHAFGYSEEGSSTGIAAIGTIIAPIVDRGYPLLQLASQQIAQGHSGGPVFDDIQQAVVGMIVATYLPGQDTKNRDTAFAIPMEVLIQACPGIKTIPAPIQTNPFFVGGAIPSDRFIGRQSTLSLIYDRLRSTPPQSISITGDRRIGKSSVLRYIVDHADQISNPPPVVVYLDLMRAYCHTQAGFMKAMRREITVALRHEPWKEAQDIDLEALAFALEDLSQAGVRLILCLDEVEQLAKRRNEFDEVLEELRGAGQIGYVGLVTASARSLADLCQGHSLSSPFYNIFLQDTLGLFSTSDWRQWIEHALPGISDQELCSIENVAGGHPFYTQIAARNLWDALCAGGDQNWQQRTLTDIDPYWNDTWQHLNDREQAALRVAAGLPGQAPNSTLSDYLHRRGLLRKGRPFSQAFTDWILSM